MDTSISVETTLAGTWRKTASKTRSAILQGRGKSQSEACCDGEDTNMEDVRKEEGVAAKKKGGRSG